MVMGLTALCDYPCSALTLNTHIRTYIHTNIQVSTTSHLLPMKVNVFYSNLIVFQCTIGLPFTSAINKFILHGAGLSVTIIGESEDDQYCIAARRFQLIGQVNLVLCLFGKLDPITKKVLSQCWCGLTVNNGVRPRPTPSVVCWLLDMGADCKSTLVYNLCVYLL
jgi:hypothetical protein